MVAIKGTLMPRCCQNCFLIRYNDILGYSCKATKNYITNANVVLKRADNCPLVEIEERKAGEWVNTHDEEEWFGEEYKCSLCGEVTIDNGLYCPHCGAEMENGEKND